MARHGTEAQTQLAAVESAAERDASPIASAAASVFVVVPAYREESVIGAVVQRLLQRWPNVIVVDDGSGDRTAERAREAGAEVLQHVLNRGQGAALQTGVEWALRRGAQIVVTFDADGQHPPDAIDALIQPIIDGDAQVVFGSRFLKDAGKVPFMRRMLIRAAVLFTRASTGAKVTDAHNGMRAFDRASAAALELRLDRMAHASEIIDKVLAGRFSYTEVAVAIEYTDYSRAKGQSSAAAFRILWDYMLSKVMS